MVRRKGAWILVGWAIAVHPVAALETPDLGVPAIGVVCGSAEAYSGRVRRGERQRLEEQAKRRALADLASLLWAEALGERAVASLPEGAAGRATRQAFPSLVYRYRLFERLEGGTVHTRGGKRDRTLQYCVPEELYRRARGQLRDQRREAVENLRGGFAELERLIESGDMEAASRKRTSLDIEVVGEALEDAVFESPTQGRSLTFHVWLLEWGDMLPKDEALVSALNQRAAELIAGGQLEEASRYLFHAAQVDWQDERTRELRIAIEDRNRERLEMLDQAELLAARGDFDGAEELIEQARRLGRDDRKPLDESQARVAGYRAEYLANNPRTIPGVFVAFGNLGVDDSLTADRLGAAAGVPLDPSPALSVGAGASFRLSRIFIVGFGADWGIAQDTRVDASGNAVDLYQFVQLAGGVGIRTPRPSGRKMSVRVLVGPVWEWAEIGPLFEGDFKGSDSQLAYFARVSLDWPRFAIFAQHGLGFEDDPGSPIGWSDSLQVGIGANF
jgi:hypothetical protein